MALNNPKFKILPPNIDLVIEGKTLLLVPFSINEMNKQYLRWLNDPQINEFLEIRHKRQTMKDIFDYVNGLRSGKKSEIFAIFTKGKRIHIGNIAITEDDKYYQGNLSYGILIGDTNAQKLGFGAEASVLMIDFLFRNPKIRRLQEGVIAKNTRSWQTLELLGFKKEGILRKHSVLASSEISDLYLYGMLRDEWVKNRPRFDFILRNSKIIPR